MNRNMYTRNIQDTIPGALFIALEGLYAAPVIAGNGVVVLQRHIPVHPVIHAGIPGNTTSADALSDKKIQTALKTTEFDDANFAAAPLALKVPC